jgi:hypothetical protein
MHIGTCGHEIDNEWFNDARSCYTILDSIGVYLYVTTCKKCRQQNENDSIIVDSDNIPFLSKIDSTSILIITDKNGNKKVIYLDNDETVERKKLSDYFQ